MLVAQKRVRPASRRDEDGPPGALANRLRNRLTERETTCRRRTGRIDVGRTHENTALVADDAAAIGVDGDWHDRVVESLAVPIEKQERIGERMSDSIAGARPVRIGHVDAGAQSLRHQILTRLAMSAELK